MSVRFLIVIKLFFLMASFPSVSVAQDSVRQPDERQQYIVQFRLPEMASTELGAGYVERAVSQRIELQASNIIERVFPASGYNAFAESREILTFNITPAMVMFLNENEVVQLQEDEAVTSISLDRIDRPVLSRAMSLIGANVVHSQGHRGAGGNVAILDTGIFYDHPAFSGRIRASACFSTTIPESGVDTTCPNGDIEDYGDFSAAACTLSVNADDCAHGSHVASIAAGGPGIHPYLGNYTLSGVAPEAGITPIQVFSYIDNAGFCGFNGRCIGSLVSDQILALEWLFENRETLELSAVNMSLGGDSILTACDFDPRREIFQQLTDAGIPVVVAGGNESRLGAVSSPACISTAIVVSGDQFATSSRINYLAPTQVHAAGNLATGDLSQTFSGTSMATPQVAGAITLLSQAFPEVTTEEILEALRVTGLYLPVSTIDQQEARQVYRPRIRVDLAYAYLASGTLPNTAVRFVSPSELIFTGLVDDLSTYNVERITIENISSTFVSWVVNDYEGLLSFDWVPSLTSRQTPYSVNSEGISGHLSPGERVTLQISIAPEYASTDTARYGSSPIVNGEAEILINGTPRLLPVSIIRSFYPARNDDIRNAFITENANWTDSEDFGRATLEDGEPSLGGAVGSVWFAWRVPFTGDFRVDSDTPSENPFSVFMVGSNTVDGVSDLPAPLATNVVTYSGRANANQIFYFQVAAEDTHAQRVGLNVRLQEAYFLGWSPLHPYELDGASGYVDPYYIDWQERFGAGPVPEGDPFELSELEYRQSWFRWTAPRDGTFYVSNQYGGRSKIITISMYEHLGDARRLQTESDLEMLRRISVAELGEVGQGAPFPDNDRYLSAEVVAGRTYWIRLGHQSLSTESFTYGYGLPSDGQLVGSVLPGVRRAETGDLVTAFMTVINPESRGRPASNCRIIPHNWSSTLRVRYPFSYQMTNASNDPVGSINPLFDLEPGEAQSFVLRFDGVRSGGGRVNFNYTCDDVLQPRFRSDSSVDRFNFQFDDVAELDIIPIAVTPSGDGILDVRNDELTAFAVAAVNNSPASGTAEVSAPTWVNGQVFGVTLCETVPDTGECISAPRSALDVDFQPYEVKTFTVFVRLRGAEPSFNPAIQRTTVTFDNGEQVSGTSGLYGQTSIAIRALGD